MSTYTASLGLELITPGSQAGLWGNTTNNTFSLIDQAVTGVTPVNLAALSGTTYVLTDYNGATDEARSAVLNIYGIATGANTVVVPNKQKTYLVRNSTGQDVTLQTATPSATYVVGAGYSILVFCDGNNNVYSGIASPGVGTVSVNAGGTGSTTFTAGFIKSTGGTNALTSASAVNLATETTGTLTVPNGGTGVTSFTSGGVLVGNGTGNLATVTGSVAGYVLTWNGSQWVAAASAAAGVSAVTAASPLYSTGGTTPEIGINGTIGVSNGGTGVTSFTSGAALVGNGSGALSTVTASTTGSVFTWNGTRWIASTAPAWPAAQTVSGLGTGVGGWITSSGGLTSFLSNNSVQVGYNSVGVYAASSSVVSLYTASTYWAVTGNNVEYSGSGNAYKPGGGSWAASSDARLKENVKPLQNALGVISALNPVSYTWKYKTSEPTVGFIAQDVQKILPSSVNRVEPTDDQKPFVGSDDVYAIGWQNDLTAYLIGAIKELKAEIDALKAAK